MPFLHLSCGDSRRSIFGYNNAVNTHFGFTTSQKDTHSRARLGTIQTPHGEIQTPAFIPVGTKATVKTLTPEELQSCNAQAVLANTYHLYLSPGPDVIGTFGGFAPFMGWNGPTFTDSGGYQVSFLWNPQEGTTRSQSVKITDEGATFRSHIDGSKHLITPELSMEIQEKLGADIIMAFDQPLSLDSSERKQKEAFDRTLRWEERSFIHWEKLQKNRGNYQALFGVIQGETDEKLRRQSLDFLLALGFPGLAIGGASIGSDPQITAAALDTIVDVLPDDKPLHALGLGGGVEGIFEAVERGVDTFDNTSVTRMARTGIVFLYQEEGGTKTNKFRTDVRKYSPTSSEALSLHCDCYTCTHFTKGYVRHLIVSDELLGGRLITIHNVFYMNKVMSQVRESIERHEFKELKESWIR